MWIANSPINPSTFLWKIRYSQSDDVCILAHGAWTENSEIAATWKGPVLPSPSRLHLHFRGTRRSMMCKDVKISGLKVAVGYWVKTWKNTNFEEWDSTKTQVYATDFSGILWSGWRWSTEAPVLHYLPATPATCTCLPAHNAQVPVSNTSCLSSRSMKSFSFFTDCLCHAC